MRYFKVSYQKVHPWTNAWDRVEARSSFEAIEIIKDRLREQGYPVINIISVVPW